jgi:hypothetical protein
LFIGETMTPLKEKIRTVTFLSREQIDYLDNLGKDAMFYQGTKLSRAQILCDLVSLLITLGIDAKEINFKKGSFVQGLLDIVHHNGGKVE